MKLVELKKPTSEKLIKSAEEFLERVRSGKVTGALMYYKTKDECFWLYSGFDALEAWAHSHDITPKPGESYYDLRQRCLGAA